MEKGGETIGNGEEMGAHVTVMVDFLVGDVASLILLRPYRDHVAIGAVSDDEKAAVHGFRPGVIDCHDFAVVVDCARSNGNFSPWHEP